MPGPSKASPSPLSSVAFPTSNDDDQEKTPAFTPRKPLAYASGSLKPFSQSALKRNSVMALGSIQHLQYQFLKAGITSKQLAPAIREDEEAPIKLPHLNIVAQDFKYELPPTPDVPVVDRRMPWEKEIDQGPSVKNEKEMRHLVHQTVEQICNKWGLMTPLTVLRRRASFRRSSNGFESPVMPVGPMEEEQMPLVLDLLQVTTLALRKIQQYVILLPTDAFTSRSTEEDPLQILRKSSLKLLETLSSMERKYRVQPPEEVLSEDEQTRRHPRRDSSQYEMSMSSISAVLPIGDLQGYEYDPNVTLSMLSTESEVVQTYLADVDRILFRERQKNKRIRQVTSTSLSSSRGTSESESTILRRSLLSVPVEAEDSQGSGSIDIVVEEDSGGDDVGDTDELPPWAKLRSASDELSRAYMILSSHLPEQFLDQLTDPAESEDMFWESLSDGCLLSHAYNVIVRASAKPFGFIPIENIHNLKNLRQEDAIGATFRRVANLGVWAAAIKFRYRINLDSPKAGLVGDAVYPGPTQVFSARGIARKSDGWVERIRYAAYVWCEEVAKEKRDENEYTF